MKTVVYPPTGVLGLGRYRTVSIPARPLTPDAAERVVAGLALRDIFVAAEPGPIVQLHALTPMTTLQRVRATAAFRDETDCRLAWDGAVA